MTPQRSTFGLAAAIAVTVLAAAPGVAQNQRAARPPQQQPAAPTAAPQPAPAANGDVARSSFIQSMDADFRKRDLDSDGKVTRAELEQFERNGAIAAAQAQNRALFATLDSDRNGVLTPGEFAGLVRNVPTPDVSGQMLRLDANRDQVVSLVEYRTATLINFDRLDADKDGIVTERELAASNPAPARSPTVGR